MYAMQSRGLMAFKNDEGKKKRQGARQGASSRQLVGIPGPWLVDAASIDSR